MNKRLYVLEDIDCGGLEDIVKKRTSNTEVDEDVDGETMADLKAEIVKLKNQMNDRERKEQKINNGEITLSDILEVFDGVMETKVLMGLSNIKLYDSYNFYLGKNDGDNN